MRILNLQVSKDKGLRIVENHEGGIDFVEFKVDDHYVSEKVGVNETLLVSIPINRRELVSEFIKLHVMIEDKPAPKPERT